MSRDWQAKLDARGRRHLAAGDCHEAIGLLVLTAAPLAEEQLAALERAGMTTYAAEGTVLSGTVDGIEHLRLVAELPFVVRIELPRRTHPE